MELKIDLAGEILRITGPDHEMFLEPGPLAPFITEEDRIDREVNCGIVDELPQPRGVCIYHDARRWVYRDDDADISYIGAVADSADRAYIRTERRSGRTDIRVKRAALPSRITSKTILNGLEAEHLAVTRNGFLFHCSYIDWQNSAILFTAPSGVGKSTQAELWRRYRDAKIINGDRAVVRLGEKGVEAWGVPFSGSSGISHRSCLPVKAIVCLSQAPKTTIRRLSGVRAFRSIWEGCSLHTWDRDDVTRCSETVLQVVSQIPVFHLACTPDESAVCALEDALSQIVR